MVRKLFLRDTFCSSTNLLLTKKRMRKLTIRRLGGISCELEYRREQGMRTYDLRWKEKIIVQKK
jgi:hypothetical protein